MVSLLQTHQNKGYDVLVKEMSAGRLTDRCYLLTRTSNDAHLFRNMYCIQFVINCNINVLPTSYNLFQILYTNLVNYLPVKLINVKEGISFPMATQITVYCVCSGDGPTAITLAIEQCCVFWWCADNRQLSNHNCAVCSGDVPTIFSLATKLCRVFWWYADNSQLSNRTVLWVLVMCRKESA